MALKDIQIKALKPREKIYRIADGDGLTIEVRTNGAKFWRYRYRVPTALVLRVIGRIIDVAASNEPTTLVTSAAGHSMR